MMFEKFNLIHKFKPVYFLCALCALVIGFTGQILLGDNQLVPAAVFYTLAVVLIIIAFRKQPGPNVAIPPFRPAPTVKWRRLGYVTGGLSVLSALLAFFLFTTSTPAVVPWLLHLTSLALLIVSIIWVDGIKRPEDRKKSSLDKGGDRRFLGNFRHCRVYAPVSL